MNKIYFFLAALALIQVASPWAAEPASAPLPQPEFIKAYDLDFNWGPGGPNGFARPGLWADADPAKHVAWYQLMGVNVIQTFCVSCNGYAWYRNGVVPEQPGLKHDFLREVVQGAHRQGMLVLGYFCAGSNTRWGGEHPELSYGIPSEPHLPFTDEYLGYLDAAIRDAVGTTGIDGFMLDWLRLPTSRASNGGRWLACEKKLYTQLMQEPFPGEKELGAGKMTEYGRRAVERCWNVIRKAAKETNPRCIVWLTCCDINDPHIVHSRALRETDWLLNEAGDLQRTADALRMIGPQSRLITCLANWNAQDPMEIVPAAMKQGIGLYGFTQPGTNSLLPLEAMLSRPVAELKGDEKNIAVLARAFHGVPVSAIRTSDGRYLPGGTDLLAQPPSAAARLATPSPQQYAWHEQERVQFVCLDPCTWQGREYDDHSTPLSAINPALLDTDAWCRAALLWGAKEILFVAKHTGGFCWWQTESTTYGIKETPWKDGRGDVLAELSASCRRHNLSLGIYIYPGDDHWGAAGGGRTKDPAKQDAYNKVFRQQLTEVLTRYGKIAEVWFDGSCVIDVSGILRQHAADAVIFQGPEATIRWAGTESGKLPYPAWNSLLSRELKTGVATAAHGKPDGDAWAPLEADTTLYNHNWFWSADNELKRKSLKELMDIYYQSAGHGGVLLLNSTPNMSGLIPQGDLKLYEAFGREIERRFSQPVAELHEQRGYSVELALARPALINHAVIMEDYRQGERIREYILEGFRDGQWQELKQGVSVGRKKIDRFEPLQVSRVRLRVTKSGAEPILRRLEVFYVEEVSDVSLNETR